MKGVAGHARPLIMGIVNVTPDSFSGDGWAPDGTPGRVVDHMIDLLRQGADILDIGGESTRPGATPVDAEEETRRVVPAIALLRERMGKNPVISVDTSKAVVAEAALKAGADIINDISALGDPAMAGVVAHHKCMVVLMHNRADANDVARDARIGGSYGAPRYGADVVEDVRTDLMRSVDVARRAGIDDARIILDPGLGFGKSMEQNMRLIRQLERLAECGFPLLMGPSRKSFIGQALDLPVEERLEGTAAAVALCAYHHAAIIRVHDVKFMARVSAMAAAIRNS